MFRMPKLSRRHLLRGAGAAIALPALEAMMTPNGLVRSRVEAQPEELPKRFVVFVWPNGAMMRDFTPAERGTGWSMTPCLGSFAGRESEITIVTGLTNFIELNDLYDDFDINHHPLSASLLLTGGVRPMVGPLERPDPQQGGTRWITSAGGPSVDKIAAMSLGAGTAIPSLTVYSDYYAAGSYFNHRYTWNGIDSPGDFVENPSRIFDYLFSDFTGDPMAADRRRVLRQSILDSVRGSITDLKRQLGTPDQHRLDEHLEAIRQLELRSTAMLTCSLPADPGDETAYSAPELVRERAEVSLQLSVMALGCDLTRVLVFCLGETANGVDIQWMGLPNNDHGFAHWTAADPSTMDGYRQTTTWKVAEFARLLELMESTVEGDGTLVDRSAIVGTSEFSDGGLHMPDMHPVLVAGRLGAHRGGSHLVVPCEPHRRSVEAHPNLAAFGSTGVTPMANLWLTQLQAVGAGTTSFGRSTGTLGGLWI